MGRAGGELESFGIYTCTNLMCRNQNMQWLKKDLNKSVRSMQVYGQIY